ncbi:hypothetical protein [Streptomyces exfoliatus]
MIQALAREADGADRLDFSDVVEESYGIVRQLMDALTPAPTSSAF